ncbi:MAG: hypothetical protein AB7O28_15810 [Vicinamibacterales bacterium]
MTKVKTPAHTSATALTGPSPPEFGAESIVVPEVGAFAALDCPISRSFSSPQNVLTSL